MLDFTHMRLYHIKYILLLIFFVNNSYAQESGSHYCSRSKIVQNSDYIEIRETESQENFDILFYNISLEIFPSSKTITGSVLIRSNIKNSNDNLEIDLNSSLFVSSIILGNKNLSFEHKNDLLNIKLDRIYTENENIEIVINYSGTPGATFHFDTKDGSPWIWTLSEPYGAMDWWPCKNFPDDKADSVFMEITVPSDLIVASNGVLFDQLNSGNKTTFLWKEKYAIASYLVSLAIHPYRISTDHFKYTDTDSMAVINYIIPSAFDVNAPKYKITIDMLEAFSEKFGLYPFINEKYGHAEFPWNGGMEHQTITSLLGPYEFLIAHELAHQWWGDMITCRDFHHIWLNEGFATYSEALWEEYKTGITGLHNTMKNKMYLSEGRIYVDNIEDQGRIFNQGLSYNKAAWVLHMLRHVVGDDVFFQILKAWGASDKRFGVAVTEDFRQVCEQVSNIDLDDFFNQWIYGYFHPVYLYDWDYREGQGKYDVNLTIEQFQTDGLYKMPIDVSIQTDAGEEKFRVYNDEKLQSFSFNLSSKPMDLKIDKDNWILKEVREGISMVNHDNNEMLLSLSAEGSLGFDTPDGFGNGLIYPSDGRNTLFYGSLMIGNSKEYVSDNSEFQARKDFVKLQGNRIGIGKTTVSDQDINIEYSDSGHPESKGLDINQTSYSWSSYPNRNFIILKYNIINNGQENMENVFPALFLDLDIGDYLNNYIKKDEERNLLYQYNGDVYIGIKKLNPDGKNAIFSGIIDAIDKFAEQDKYDYLTGIKNQYLENKKADWSSLLSSGPYKLNAGDSLEINFAIVGGSTEQELKSNADTAQEYFNDFLISSYELVNEDNTGIILSPNPANGRTIIYFENEIAGDCSLEIYNITGNKMRQIKTQITDNKINIDTSGFPAGIYTVKINFNRQSAIKKLIVK